tara:strand:- start:812 stop:1630 length:819 start_codon:yes stop_codon:yes gene_type:complete
MKNLILTICMNYNYDIFERFIGSLFDSINNTELMIFISINDIIHIKKLKNKYANINYKVVDTGITHVVNYRFKMYYEYLKNKKYDYIFLCDSRDVLFQKDIFKHPMLNNNNDLYVFEEESSHITVDTCQFNSLYIKRSGLNIDIINKPIICVGTILGNMKGIMEYLKHFNNILDNEINIDNYKYYGVDSGINYKIIYSNLLQNIKVYICKNSDNLVYTMAFPIYLDLIDYKKLLNNEKKIMYDENVSYCVHQYDRLDENIKKSISHQYNYIL